MRQVPFHKASAAARGGEAVTPTAAAAGAGGPADAEKTPFDPGRIVRRSLVGRYRFACWLGVWGGGGWVRAGVVFEPAGLPK